MRSVGKIAAAFDRIREIDAAVARAWIANLSGRRANARLAHLMCELDLRAARQERSCLPFDLTQEDWADGIGVSTIQLNRTLAELRAAGLVAKRGRRLAFRDHVGLARLGDFNPAYLQ